MDDSAKGVYTLRMPEETNETAKPEPFSPMSATLAVEEMWRALAKTKRIEYIENLNEVLIVIGALSKDLDRNKEVK